MCISVPFWSCHHFDKKVRIFLREGFKLHQQDHNWLKFGRLASFVSAQILKDAVDGSEIRRENQLRLVVGPPIIFPTGFSTIQTVENSRRISGCHQQYHLLRPAPKGGTMTMCWALSHHKVVEVGHQPNSLTTKKSACLDVLKKNCSFTLHSDQDCLGSRQNWSLKPGTWQRNTTITSILNHLQSNLQEHPASSCCLFWLFDHFATRKFQHLKHLSQCQILSSSKFLHVQCCISLRDQKSGVLQLSVEVEIHQECPHFWGDWGRLNTNVMYVTVRLWFILLNVQGPLEVIELTNVGCQSFLPLTKTPHFDELRSWYHDPSLCRNLRERRFKYFSWGSEVHQLIFLLISVSVGSELCDYHTI